MCMLFFSALKCILVIGNLNSKLPTIWRVEKQMKSRWDAVKSEERRCNSAKVRRKKIHNVREVAKGCVFSMIRVSGQSKSRAVKAAGAESCGQRINQKLHAAVVKSTFGRENVQNTVASQRFLKFRCRKLHAAVARSTFSSEKAQNTIVLAHFLKFRCRKISQLAS